MERLSPRQLDVLRLRCLGKTGSQIAARINVEPGTVANMLTGAYEKLDIHGGSRDAWACYLLGMCDATRVLPPVDPMRADAV